MKSKLPQFKKTFNKDGNLVFTGTIQPAEWMREFNISIEFRGDNMPRVRVLTPKLHDTPPHFYRGTGSLCLYKPENFKWSGNKLIAEHIVKWTSCWLYFYEVWEETNLWIGPEAEHNKTTEKHE